MKYTFGTSASARERLRLIASFFNPLAIDIIRSHIESAPSRALDIGCGPGFTTDMLARATQAGEVTGIDNSPRFLDEAKKQFPKYAFLKHDVTALPFPVRAEVAYVRFVLSHLRDPVRVIDDWVSQLETRGFLFIDEVEAVDTTLECFKTYLSVNDAIVASQGAMLFVGGEIASGTYDANVVSNECSVLPVPDGLAARWFLPNVRTIWKKEPVAAGLVTKREARSVEKELSRMIRTGGDSSRITWRMRRIVLRKKS